MSKHRIIVIGWLGSRSCYLDVPREEAVRRWEDQNKEKADPDLIDEFDIDDEFWAYDASAPAWS